MFGKDREIAELEERIDALSKQLDEVRTDNEVARRLLDDAHRLEQLAQQARELSEIAAATLSGLQTAAADAGVQGMRFEPDFNVVYHADVAGYLAVFNDGGFTDRIELLVGSDDPPTEVVATANSRNDINSYAGTVVRPGEHWMIQSKVGAKSGMKATFTPLF